MRQAMGDGALMSLVAVAVAILFLVVVLLSEGRDANIGRSTASPIVNSPGATPIYEVCVRTHKCDPGP